MPRARSSREKVIGDWLITGDLGRMDDDGYFWFQGRADDVITSSGYRIGPSEIEDALIKHPAVRMAAVIGVPDPVRTEIIKAFAILNPGHAGTGTLADELREAVRTRMAKHEVPRLIEFVDSLPMTTTGKIMRRELRVMEKSKQSTWRCAAPDPLAPHPGRADAAVERGSSGAAPARSPPFRRAGIPAGAGRSDARRNRP
jgi:acyl-coenzyme A synthetase/AMP-(fatty) acid ligase